MPKRQSAFERWWKRYEARMEWFRQHPKPCQGCLEDAYNAGRRSKKCEKPHSNYRAQRK